MAGHCVARSVIVVAGKFATILICSLDLSCITHSHDLFCVFCVFGGQGFFGLTKKAKKMLVRLDGLWRGIFCDGPF